MCRFQKCILLFLSGVFAARFDSISLAKNSLLLLAALPGLTLFCIVASLKVPAMIIYDVATEEFPQHNVADRNWHYFCFVQLWEAFSVKGNKQTRTHARVRTHKEREREKEKKRESIIIIFKVCLYHFHVFSTFTANKPFKVTLSFQQNFCMICTQFCFLNFSF